MGFFYKYRAVLVVYLSERYFIILKCYYDVHQALVVSGKPYGLGGQQHWLAELTI